MPIARLSTGIDLYYEVHGSGEPLVLVPSTAFPAGVWWPYQVPELSRSLQSIVFDPRGVGRSPHAGGVYTIELMAADTLALLDEMGIRSAHVLGHSMGGRIALAMALDHPGRVASLLLCATGSGPAGRSGEECVPGLPFRLVTEMVELGFEGHVRHEIFDSGTFFTDGFRRQHPEVVQDLWDRAWPHHSHLPEYVRQVIARHNWEGTHRLSSLRMPALVVVGDADVVGSSHVPQAQALADRIPGAEFKVLPGQSHGFFWQAPEETNAWILDWVRRHPIGSG